MTSRSLLQRLRPSGDAGASMIIILMVIAVLGALGTAAAAMAVSNARSTTADRQAGGALNVSEGGIAQAVAWIEMNGVGKLACSPSCATLDWGNSTSPHLVTLPNNQSYKVWIEKIQQFLPPNVKTGLYRIHSTGNSGSGPGARSVQVDLQVAPASFPIGVFAHTVQAGGTGGIHYESLFSDNCVQGRQFETFTGTDAYYGIPAAVHSANYIVPKQNDSCVPGKSIHSGANCNTAYPNDTDLKGGPLTAGDGCYGNGPTFNGTTWLTNSSETSSANMAAFYGYKQYANGLSNTVLDKLRTAAQEQGFYFTNTTAIPAALQAANAWQTIPYPVLFYDLQGAAVGGTVDLSNLTGYSRSYPLQSTDSGCQSMGALVIVLNGNVKLNANTVLTASVFAPGPNPNGQVTKANGTGQLIGTVYADSVDQRGTSDIYLDPCFLANLPGPLLGVTMKNFVEKDRP